MRKVSYEAYFTESLIIAIPLNGITGVHALKKMMTANESPVTSRRILRLLCRRSTHGCDACRMTTLPHCDSFQ